MQASALISYLPSPSAIAPTGHSPAQEPQLMHAPLITYAIGIAPVSYTHLDVYKRQQYIYGATGTGKTRGVYQRHGAHDIYRVTNYQNGKGVSFDDYHGQDVIAFEEFTSQPNRGNAQFAGCLSAHAARAVQRQGRVLYQGCLLYTSSYFTLTWGIYWSDAWRMPLPRRQCHTPARLM